MSRPATSAERRAFVEAHVPGWLTHEEGEALYALARTIEIADGGFRGWSLVELGAWKGRSTCYLAWGALDGYAERGFLPWVVSVDHFCGSPEHLADGTLRPGGSTYGEYIANLKAAGVADWVAAICASSADAANANIDPVVLLFIDADHTEAAVRRDHALWAPKVEPGGWVCLHDVDSPDWPGPTRLGAELRGSGEWDEVRQVDTLLMLRKRA